MFARRSPALVSCHVERPLDDRAWAAFSTLQTRTPGGFRVAALMRPPDRAAGEDEELWLERARAAAARAPFGLHTHWGSPEQARPTDGDPAERVGREVAWLREHGLAPKFFCGGGWYMDAGVAQTVAELELTDCSATAFRPSYLPVEAPRLELGMPARFRLPSGALLPELPATHSLGMLARAVLGPLPTFVHAYFHDTDLLVPRRRLPLEAALRLLGLRRRPTDLDDAVSATLEGPERPFADAARP
jgi:hypothetical protein